MHASVREKFQAFNEPFEGVVRYMYVDVLQLVTIGVGNLIDPLEAAVALPFRLKNKPGVATPGAPATQEQIAEEWRRIKGDTRLAKAGHLACAPITNLELSDEAIHDLVLQRLTANEIFLKRQPSFRGFESWPADGQLGVLSMAWAIGVGRLLDFKKFGAACAAMDFRRAAAECKISEAGNPGVIPRNEANHKLLINAALVIEGEARGLERSKLYYPNTPTQSVSAT